MFKEVVQLVGKRNAEKLRARFGGSSTYWPVLEDEDMERRNAQIRKARELGASISELMTKHALGRRQIWNILSEETAS